MDSSIQTPDIAQTLMPSPNFVPSGANAAGNDGTPPFADFLSQNQASFKSQLSGATGSFIPHSNAAKSSGDASQAANTASTAKNGSFMPALKKLTTALHTLLQKLQPHNTSSKAANDGSANDPASAAQTPDAQNSAAVVAALVSVPTSAPPQTVQATDTSGAIAATDNTKQPTISDLLSQLDQILRALEKKMQQAMTVQGNGTADASATTANNGTTQASDNVTQGAPTLTQMLNELLALTQMIAKRLETMQANGTAGDAQAITSANTSTGSDAAQTAALPTSLFAIETQVKNDLKTLLDALNTHATGDAKGSASLVGADGKTNSANTQVAADTPARTVSPADILARTPSQIVLDTVKAAPPAAAPVKTPAPLQTAEQPASSGNNNEFVALATATGAADTGRQGAALNMGLQSQGQNSQGQNNEPSQQGASGASSTITGANLAALTDVAKASPYGFASQLSAVRALEGATGLPSAVEQVILQMNRNVKTGNDQMTLQLNPADLGRVDIRLNIAADGKVQGTVVAENPTTLHMLSKDVGSLERALQDAGLRADPGSLQFSLGNQSGNSGQASEGSAQSSGKNGNDNGAVSGAGDAAALASDQPEVWYITPGRVNFKV